jgi:parallel beta-helix repeat protein
MKPLFVSFFVVFSSKILAIDYYISSSGNDSNPGNSPKSPWKSIEKVNSIFPYLKPGDKILFSRNDTLTGTLKISKSGSADKSIIIGSFGEGNDPVISSFVSLDGWTTEGKGIYSKTILLESSPSVVLIDGKQYGMGRYPNTSYLNFESHKANYSITDNQLPDNPDWTGAEIVICKHNWMINSYLILMHKGHTIEYQANGDEDYPENNRWYFLQNDLKTLDSFGEWYFNKSENKLFIYFGNENPEKFSIRVAAANNLAYNNTKSYIIVDGITFEGSIQDAVSFSWGANCIIRNCCVKYAGKSGMDIKGKNNRIESNEISWCNMAGIYTEGANVIITQNTVQNIGLIPGSSSNGEIRNAIFVGGDNSLIEYNTVRNVGKSGISVGKGWITSIKHNFVSNFMLTLNDGGGIYVDGNLEKNRVIENNIILNGKGNGVDDPPAVCGIDLDEYSANVIVRKNTVAFNAYGINLHKANSDLIEDNLFFGNGIQIAFHNTSFVPTIYKIKIINNIFFSLEKTDPVLFFRSITDDIPHFGDADNNYYARPLGDENIFYTFSTLTGKKYRTLSDWQSFTGEDINSHESPLALKDTIGIRFYYNASENPKVIPLEDQMTDIKGAKYEKSLTLDPFSSIVLIPLKNR